MQALKAPRNISRTIGGLERACAYFAVIAALLLTPLATRAAPILAEEAFLAGSSGTSLQIIGDGSSNTIIFTEHTVLNLCLRGVAPLPGITDGTSDTIIIGETAREDLCFENFFDVSNWQEVLSTIVDGTSNTLLIGEETQIGFDRRSRIDLCASNVNLNIVDGTSNTIVFAETVCFNDVRIATRTVAEPQVSLALLALGLLLLALLRATAQSATARPTAREKRIAWPARRLTWRSDRRGSSRAAQAPRDRSGSWASS
jgi:hypothetical protein